MEVSGSISSFDPVLRQRDMLLFTNGAGGEFHKSSLKRQIELRPEY